jgi:uncharacterized membrane protein YphA (DoxX/SURF4 family)
VVFRSPLSLCICIDLRFEIPREGPLQRLFSTFPDNWPGIALLLLRAAIGVTAVGQGAIYLSHAGGWTFELLSCSAMLLAGGFCLLIGFLTPLVAALIGIAVLVSAVSLPLRGGYLFNNKLATVEIIVMAVAIGLLGPGAFSMDARLFGRREIVIPAGSSTPKSPLPPVS